MLPIWSESDRGRCWGLGVSDRNSSSLLVGKEAGATLWKTVQRRLPTPTAPSPAVPLPCTAHRGLSGRGGHQGMSPEMLTAASLTRVPAGNSSVHLGCAGAPAPVLRFQVHPSLRTGRWRMRFLLSSSFPERSHVRVRGHGCFPRVTPSAFQEAEGQQAALAGLAP